MKLGWRQEIRWRLDGVIGRIKCFFGAHDIDGDYGPYCLYCYKKVLPRGWFLAEGENGFWVVYDANCEPQTVEKSPQKAIDSASVFAKHLGLVY